MSYDNLIKLAGLMDVVKRTVNKGRDVLNAGPQDGVVGEAIHTARKGVTLAKDVKNHAMQTAPIAAAKAMQAVQEGKKAIHQKALEAKKLVNVVRHGENRDGLVPRAYDIVTKDIPHLGESAKNATKNYAESTLNVLKDKAKNEFERRLKEAMIEKARSAGLSPKGPIEF